MMTLEVKEKEKPWKTKKRRPENGDYGSSAAVLNVQSFVKKRALNVVANFVI